MNKKVYEKVLERSQGLCEICGSNNIVELHHIVKGNGKRNKCETVEGCIMLCFEHHKGTSGVHGRMGHALDIILKLQLQEKYFKQGKSEDEVRKLMGGKLYIGSE